MYIDCVPDQYRSVSNDDGKLLYGVVGVRDGGGFLRWVPVSRVTRVNFVPIPRRLSSTAHRNPTSYFNLCKLMPSGA
jgi:hypothetical protein